MKIKKIIISALSLVSFMSTAGEWQYYLHADKLTGAMAFETVMINGEVNQDLLSFMRDASGAESVQLRTNEGLIDCNPYRVSCQIRVKVDKDVFEFEGSVSKDFKMWSTNGVKAKYQVILLKRLISNAKNIKIEYPSVRKGLVITEFATDTPVQKYWTSFYK